VMHVPPLTTPFKRGSERRWRSSSETAEGALSERLTREETMEFRVSDAKSSLYRRPLRRSATVKTFGVG
jgi:hypothetical protein